MKRPELSVFDPIFDLLRQWPPGPKWLGMIRVLADLGHVTVQVVDKYEAARQEIREKIDKFGKACLWLCVE